MIAQMQLGGFTHGKCTRCNYLGEIGKFESKKTNAQESAGVEVYQLVLICPICQDEFCEALFPNEVN